MRAPESVSLVLVASALLGSMLACDPGGGSARAMTGEPALNDRDFSQSWIVINRVGTGKPIDAVARGPAGFVAITHVPTGDAKIVAPQNIGAVSVDGVNWIEQMIVPNGYYYDVAYGAGRYVAVGGAAAPGGGPGAVIASTDGRAWSAVGSAGFVLRRVQHTPGGFVTVGMGGSALTSIDGITWRTSSLTGSPPAELFRDATYGAGRFVAAGTFALHTSPDGQTWSRIVCGPRLPCQTVIDPSGGQHGILNSFWALYGNGVFLTSGLAGLLRSVDAETWSLIGTGRGSDIIFAGGLFVERVPLDREMNTLFTVSASRDGSVWQERTTASVVPSDLTCSTNRCLVFPSAILLIP